MNVHNQIINWVTAIPDGDIVAIAVHDSAGNDEPAAELAELLAFTDEDDLDLGFRDTMCLIGRRGSEEGASVISWQTLVTAARYEGPSDCEAIIQTGSYQAEVLGNYDIVASDLTWNGESLARNIWVRVLSIGYDDPGYGCVSDGSGCTGLYFC